MTSQYWMPSASIEQLQQRADILASIRLFFAERKVMEVDTPAIIGGRKWCDLSD